MVSACYSPREDPAVAAFQLLRPGAATWQPEVRQEEAAPEAPADGDSDDEDEDHPLSASAGAGRSSVAGGVQPLKPLKSAPERCDDLLLVQRLG